MTSDLFSKDALARAADLVHRSVPPTPLYAWPLLKARTGVDVWVKHENHTPTGAFKARGAITYMDALRRSSSPPAGVVTATRGNHGQSVALAATSAGLRAVVYVPKGNSEEKNAAMRAFGAELVVHGDDFDSARKEAARVAEAEGLHFTPSFHPELCVGVATYAAEMFAAAPDLDVVYAPIGMGSGLCGLITVRDLMGLTTEIVGVVAEAAPAFALSVEAGRPIATETAWTFADGMACREPQPEPLEIIRRGAARIVRVSEDGVAEAIRAFYADTHNLAEGAGAAGLAALMQERARLSGKKAGVVLCGANIDAPVLAEVLAGRTPRVGPALEDASSAARSVAGAVADPV